MLSFLVSSLGGSYSDLVCFVPVVTLNWNILLFHFKKVMSALQTIGLNVLLIIVDGHKTNVRFYVELCEGNLKVSTSHPFNLDRPLFLMFDPVHLFKNFFNNFERHG